MYDIADGSLLSLDELWNSIPKYYVERLEHERWSFITQQVLSYRCASNGLDTNDTTLVLRAGAN